jgi:hypothetical protein
MLKQTIQFFVVVLATASLYRTSTAEVVTYSAPAEAAEYGLTSDLFSVTVNGQSVPVYRGPDEARSNCFCSFDFESEIVTVIIEHKSAEWSDKAIVRPLSSGIRHQQKGRKLGFRLTRPINLSIETDGTYASDLLMLFANPMVTDAEKKATHVFNPGYPKEMRSLNLQEGESVYVDGGAIVEGLRIDGKGSIVGRGILVNDLRPNAGQSDWRTNMISGKHISGVIQFKTDKHGFWGCQPGGGDWVIDNLKIISDGSTDDGIDPQAISGNGVIRNCFLRVKDDCISPKMVPWFDHQRGRPCHGISVSNCVLFNTEWGCGTRIGVQVAGPVNDIRYENLDVIHAGGGPEHEGALVIWVAAEGDVSNVTYDGIRLEDVNPSAGNRSVSLLVEPYNGVDHSRGFGSISNIAFKNIAFNGLAYSSMKGHVHEGIVSEVRDILFKGCTRDGHPIKNAYDLRLLFLDDNVRAVKFEGGPTYDPGVGYVVVDCTKADHIANGFAKVTKNADPNVKLLGEKGTKGASFEFPVSFEQAGLFGVLARTGAGWQHDYAGKVRLVVNNMSVGELWDQSNTANAGNGVFDFGRVELKRGVNVFRFELSETGGDGIMDLAWFQAVYAPD